VLKRICFNLVLACAGLVAATGASAYSNALACGNWTIGGINLMCAGPTTTPGGYPDSAYWPGWAVLSVTSGVDVKFDGHALNDGGTASSLNGNVGVWGANKLYIKNDAVVSGNVYFSSGGYGTPTTSFDSSALEGGPPDWTHVDGANGFVANFKTDYLLWRAQQDALAAAAAAGGLSANVPLANIVNTDGSPSGAAFTAPQLAANLAFTQNITIRATQSGTNVINFGADLDLKSYTLTLDANSFSNVDFVLNVGHDLKGNGTSSIALGSGIAWSDVLINVENNVAITSDTVSPGGDNRYSGILLAGNDVNMSRTQWTGEVVGAHNLNFDNGSQITNPGGLISMVTFVPEPGTLLLLLLACTLGMASRAFRSFSRRSAIQTA